MILRVKIQLNIIKYIKKTCNECKQGFRWVYRYKDKDNKSKTISSVNIEKLKDKVISNGLEWKELTSNIKSLN